LNGKQQSLVDPEGTGQILVNVRLPEVTSRQCGEPVPANFFSRNSPKRGTLRCGEFSKPYRTPDGRVRLDRCPSKVNALTKVALLSISEVIEWTAP